VKPNIIIVDDDREMCEELRETLEDEGYSVRTAFNGLDGLAVVEKHGCDLLLLDLKMPGLTGEEILKRLSQGQVKPKALVLTARLLNGESARERLAEQPGWELVHDVISKPFDIDALLRMIKTLIG